MAFFRLFFKRSAEKELREIPAKDLSKITEKIKALSENPRPSGCEMIKGDERYFRIRQGDYRIVYEINDAGREVIIIKIGHRREVYK